MKRAIGLGAGLLAAVALLGACAGGPPAQAGGGGGGDGSGVVTIYVTRHGKTLFNTMDRVQGWADTPLTPAGIEVAEDLGRGLRDVKFHYVITSDMVRARQTARLVMGQNKASSGYEVADTPDLREACYGSFEGDFNANMLAAFAQAEGYGDDMASYLKSSGKDMWEKSADIIKRLDTSGLGEDAITIKTRMQKRLREVAELQAARGGGNVLLVAHGMSINIMISDMTPDYTGVSLANAAVCKVVYKDGKFTVESINDTSYIDKGKALR